MTKVARALRFASVGSFENLRLDKVELPSLKSGEAYIRVKASGINLSDVVNVLGWLPFTTTPRTPGRDFAGIVEAVADSNHQEWVGKEVWGTGGEVGFTSDGAHASLIKVGIDALSEKPKNLSFAQAASVGLPWLCAHLAVHTLAQVKEEDNVLIIGARGAIGSAALQLCSQIKARNIFGTYSKSPPEATSHIPIDLSINPSPARLLSDLGFRNKLTVVIDAYGSDTLLNDVMDILSPEGRGRIVVMAVHNKDGHASLNLRKFYAKSLTLLGLSSSRMNPTEGARMLDTLRPHFENGTFKLEKEVTEVPFDSVERIVQAYQETLERSNQSKLVFTMPNVAE
ncbi:GroES-like protein [Basidiobolus meristosporus CBS 931.73]|uniref:GroES-like protein n=1 Tax=Basidiobolus meristosporus CBS 931.73 TaxID=1314790 RepID=A0A1Y1XU82_9FUNG|nr:GroES-like protein [Basidiobolus meristosporus CBS 931.73]|eukprot:ORX89321.1 GroES-like protein [Basidiobolus meristosporus CBS 931.73]